MMLLIWYMMHDVIDLVHDASFKQSHNSIVFIDKHNYVLGFLDNKHMIIDFCLS